MTAISTAVASVKPSAEMKSRAGKPMIECGVAGGVLTATAGGGAPWSTAVTSAAAFAAGLSLLAASVARAEYGYVPAGTLPSVKVVGGLWDPSGFCTVATATGPCPSCASRKTS